MSGRILVGSKDFFNDICLRIERQIYLNRQSEQQSHFTPLQQQQTGRLKQQQFINKLDELKKKFLKNFLKKFHQRRLKNFHQRRRFLLLKMNMH